MGYFSGDWTHNEYRTAINKAKNDSKECVSLDTEHCSWKSSECLEQWGKNDGYKVSCKMDRVTIYFN